jgi:hypothetical protein
MGAGLSSSLGDYHDKPRAKHVECLTSIADVSGTVWRVSSVLALSACVPLTSPDTSSIAESVVGSLGASDLTPSKLRTGATSEIRGVVEG